MRRVIVRRFISSAILFAVLFQSFSVTGIAYANAKSDEKSYSENIPNQLMNDEKLNDFGDIDQSSKSRDISETVSCEVYKEGSISGSEKNSNADIGKEADNNKEVLVTPNTNEIDEENKVAKDVTKKPKETKKDIIVVYKDINKAKQTKDKFSSKNNREVKTKYTSKRFKMEALEISDQKNIEEVIIELTSDPNIEYVQPNYRLDSFIIPDDEHFDKQWGLLNNGQIVNEGSGVSGIDINITDAWDITTGDDNVIVAVIDTGVDISHSDLSNSIFSNINEVTNGIDDDGNGLVDDISGWDFVNNDSSVYDGPTKDVHGTGVSGIIAAGLNDTGVVGTSPDVRILPVKFIDGNSGYTSDAIKAIEYAVDMGAGIINCSWGGSEFNPVLKDVISKSNALFICAAGNASTNNNQNPVYPASFELDNIISVAAVGSDGNLATFSNYGENVDIAAPGTNILCTTPLERYDYMSGTSMAAPFVAGAAALIKSSDTNLSVSEIKARILNNVTELDSLSGKVNTTGILNTYASLLNETPPCEEPEPEPEEEEEEEVQNGSIEPWFIYDTSVEGNNKIPKPIISEKKLFVDAVDKQETSNVILSGNEEIENLNIYRVKENYVSVTWATYTEASTELCFGGAETLGQELKVDELTTKHQIMVMADENMNYYKVKSVTPSGETFESEVRSVAEDIIDLGGNAPQSFTETSPVNNNHILQDVSLLSYVYDNNDNHTIDTAQAIGECSVFGTMEERFQTDYYAINFEYGQTYTMRLTGMDHLNDYDLNLRNDSGIMVRFSTYGQGYDEIITYTSEYTGVHYIAVNAYIIDSLAEHNNYQLLVYSDDNEPDVYEPNDNSVTAQSIEDGIPVYATLNINSDEDWFAIDTTETGKLSVTLKSIPSGCDYDLEVYNADATRIFYSYASGNKNEKIDEIIGTPGRYYIRVYSYMGSNSTENYELNVSVNIPDSYEVNDNIYDVRYYARPSIDLGGSINATIDNIDDYDIYRFNINDTMNVGIRLQNIPEDNDYNLVLYSYSMYQGFFEVARSEVTGSFDETLITQLDTGYYYLMVYSVDGFSETESYTLSLQNEDTVSKVYVELDKTTASEGDIITATVKVNQIADLAGIELNLAYDPNVVMPVKDDLTPYDDKTMPQGRDVLLDDDYFAYDFASHNLYGGNIRLAFCYLYIDEYRNSMPDPVTGTVAVIKFKALRDNQIQLKFDNTSIADDNGVCLIDYYADEITEGFIIEQPQVINSNLPIYEPDSSNMNTSDTMSTSQETTICTSSSCKISGYVGIDFTSHNSNIKEGFLVELKEAGTENQSIIATTTTDLNGYFEFTQLPSGYYDIKITKDRFLKREIKDVATVFEHTGIGNLQDPVVIWIGDINGEEPDGAINMKDLVEIIKHFNTTVEDSEYNYKADLNDNNAINMEDFVLLTKHFLKASSDYPDYKYNLHSNQEIDSFIFTEGKLDLNGHTLVVNGDFTINEPTTTTYATLNINGGSLYVTGNMTLSGNARLIMRNPGDYILVNGKFETKSYFDHVQNDSKDRGGDENPCLTDGVLEVKGDFVQNSYDGGNPRNFTAIENHKVILSGNGVQLIRFDKVITQSNVDHSHFQTLEITKPLETGYTLDLEGSATVAWIRLIEAFANSTPGEGTTEDLEPIAIPRGGTATATTGAKIYAFGGYNGDYLRVIEEYDPINGSWTAIDESNRDRLELIVPRRDMGVVEVNNQIYVIGGENTDGYVGEVEEFSSITGSRIMSNIDSVTGENKCDMPTPRTKVAVTSYGNKIFAIGGYDGSYSNKVEVFDLDITKKEWTTQCTVGGQTQTIIDMPTARCGATAVEFDGYIYVVGGYNESGYLATVEKYDPINNVWTTCNDMLYKRAHFGLEVVEGKIYALGGYNGVDHLAVVEEYDPETNTWKKRTKSIASPEPYNVEEPRSSFGTAVVYSQIYIVGGENSEGYVSMAQKYVPVDLPGLKMYTGSIVKNTVGDVMLAGSYSTEISDIKVDSSGIPIELIRTYDSSDNEEKTAIGYGWRFNYDSNIVEINNYGKVTASDLNVRTGPGVGYSSYGLAPRGSIFRLETVNGEPVKENDTKGNQWYKVRLSDGKTAYMASWYVSLHSSGVEIKLGAGKTIVFDGNKTDGFTAPYGNYDHLEYMSNTAEYVLVKSDMTRYGFKKINTSDNGYRLVWIEDKHKNRVNIAGEYVNSAYRITQVGDNAGRSLTFDYSTANSITVTDNVGRVVQYLLDSTTKSLDQVINVYGKNTKYTYYTEEEDQSSDGKNVKKLKEIQIQHPDETTGVEEFKTIQRNFYHEDSGNIYKQTDAYGKVKYWKYIDPSADENVEEVLGKIERKFIDENNVSVSIQYSHFLKQPIREEYSDGSVVEYKYKMYINGAWVDTTNLTREDNESIGAISENRLNRQHIKDKYGYTTVQERDENGNLKRVTERFIDDGTAASVDLVPHRSYEYDYVYECSNNNITFRNNLLVEEEKKENNETDSYTEYVYYETNKERLKEIRRRIEGSEYAITSYGYYNIGENGYKVNGLVKTETNPDGETTTYTYYINGYVDTVEDAVGNITQYTFDDVGRITSKISPMNFKTQYLYEENGKVEKVIVSDGDGDNKPINRSSTTKIVYDGYGKKIQLISPKQYEEDGENATGTRYLYDLNGRLDTKVETLTDDAGNTEEYITKYTYDNAGNLQTEQNPDGTIYIYEYDELNRLKYKKFKKDEWVVTPVILEEYDYQTVDRSVEMPDKTYTVKDKVDVKNVYYKNGVYTPEECIQTKTITNYFDRTEEVESTEQPTVKKKYLKNGKLAAETIGNYTTYYGYDGLGRIIAKRVPLEINNNTVYYTRSKYTYSNNGNLLTEETGIEKVALDDNPSTYLVKTYVYDDNGRLEKVILPEGTQVEYEYDEDGNIMREMTNVSNYITGPKQQVIMYQNNHLGKPDRKYVFVEPEEIYGVTVPEGTNYVYAIVTDYEYDAAGNVTNKSTVCSATDSFNEYSIVETYGDPVVVDYTYDDLSRLESVTKNGLIVPEGSTTSNTVSADITTVTKYNWDGTVKQIIDAKGNITEYEYFYEDSGRVETVTSAINGLNAQGVRATSASYYDWAGRMIAEVTPEEYDENKSLEEMNHTEYVYQDNRLKEKRYKGTLTQFDPTTLSFITIDNVDMLINRYDYDDYGNMTKEWNAIGVDNNYFTEYQYNLINKVTKVIDPETKKLGTGHYSVKYDYDTFGRVISETKYKGYEVKAGEPVIYIESGQTESPYYAKTAYKYDYSGNVLKAWVKKGETDDITITESDTPILDDVYDLAGNLISHTDANGNTTIYEYNGLNQVKRVTYPIDDSMKYGSSTPYQVNYRYDAVGNVRKEYDNLNKVSLYEYDGRGLLQSQTEQKEVVAGDGTVTVSDTINTYTKYDANGNIRFEVDGNGNETEYIYDSLNRLDKTQIGVSILGGSSTHATIYTYDKNGNTLTETSSVQRGSISSDSTATTQYDELGRVIERTDGCGKSIEKVVYDENSRQKYSYDALNNRTEYIYDDNDRVVETIDPELDVTKQSYDYAGNIRTKTDGRGNITTYVYDEFDRLWYVIGANGDKTRYTYDRNGNMLTQEILKTGEQNIDTVYTSTNEYNAADKITKRIDHGGRTELLDGSYSYDYKKVVSYEYDPDGTLREEVGRSNSKTVQNGAVTTYNYDIHGSLILQTTAKAGENTIEISYVYDDNGNMTHMTDSTGLTARMYDALNRVYMKKAQDNGYLRYYYDIMVEDTTEQGETVYLTAETSRDPEYNQTTKVYDRAGRLKYVYDGLIASGASMDSVDRSKLTTYEYYDNGARSSVLYPEFVEDGYTLRYEEEYDYYNNGLLYTLLNQKVKIAYQGNPIDKIVDNVIERYMYIYDEAHNLTSKREYLTSGTKLTTYRYDELNRLKKVIEFNGRDIYYTYDSAGNRETERIVQDDDSEILNTYIYNDQNWLESIVTTGATTQTQTYGYDENGNQVAVYITEGSTTEQTASYSYDLLNRMIEATAGGETVTYTYSGDGLRVSKYVDGTLTNYIYEYDKVVLETDGYGNEVARNIYGTNLLMRTVDNQSYYYMYNGHADVTALINATTGAMDATYYYDAFGNIMESTGNVDNNITYAGYQYDEETGLYYLNARMYDPKIARFLQEDTYRGDPNDPLSLNLYTYSANNPIRYYDPTGHNYIEIFGIPFGNPFEGIKILSNTETRKKAFEEIDEYVRDDSPETNAKRIVRGSVGTYKTSKAVVKGGKDIVVGAITPLATWISFGGGEIYNWATGEDELVRETYRELMWQEIYNIGNQDSLFKPLGNWIGYAGAVIYANATGQDEEFKKILHEESLNEISRSGLAAGDSVIKPFKNTLNRNNAKNFFRHAYYTPQEELNEYATNMLVSGMTLYGGYSKLKSTGLKIDTGFQYSASANGTMVFNMTPKLSFSIVQNAATVNAAAVGNSMIAAASLEVAGGGGNSFNDKGTSSTVKTNLGNEIDITPSSNHSTTTKNPGYKGTPNSSIDIIDDAGNVQTRRWFGSDGKAIKDVDMTNHGNPKYHPEWPHEHFWEYGPDGKPINR